MISKEFGDEVSMYEVNQYIEDQLNNGVNDMLLTVVHNEQRNWRVRIMGNVVDLKYFQTNNSILKMLSQIAGPLTLRIETHDWSRFVQYEPGIVRLVEIINPIHPCYNTDEAMRALEKDYIEEVNLYFPHKDVERALSWMEIPYFRTSVITTAEHMIVNVQDRKEVNPEIYPIIPQLVVNVITNHQGMIYDDRAHRSLSNKVDVVIYESHQKEFEADMTKLGYSFSYEKEDCAELHKDGRQINMYIF